MPNPDLRENLANQIFQQARFQGDTEKLRALSNDTFMECLEYGDWYQSSRAAAWLGVKKCVEAIPVIIDAANRLWEEQKQEHGADSPITCSHHIQALAAIGSDELGAKEFLYTVVTAPNGSHTPRYEAINALIQIGTQNSLETLADAIDYNIRNPVKREAFNSDSASDTVDALQNCAADIRDEYAKQKMVSKLIVLRAGAEKDSISTKKYDLALNHLDYDEDF